MSNLKKNINQLHFQLTESFSIVNILEQSNRSFGNHFLITIEEKYTCKIVISKEKLESNQIDWKYYSNPLIEESTLVDRSSILEQMVADIQEIFQKERFDSDYLATIK